MLACVADQFKHKQKVKCEQREREREREREKAPKTIVSQFQGSN